MEFNSELESRRNLPECLECMDLTTALAAKKKMNILNRQGSPKLTAQKKPKLVIKKTLSIHESGIGELCKARKACITVHISTILDEST